MARNMHPATSERQRQTTPTSYRVVFTAPGGAIAQLGERLNGIQIGGSTPPDSSKTWFRRPSSSFISAPPVKTHSKSFLYFS